MMANDATTDERRRRLTPDAPLRSAAPDAPLRSAAPDAPLRSTAPDAPLSADSAGVGVMDPRGISADALSSGSLPEPIGTSTAAAAAPEMPLATSPGASAECIDAAGGSESYFGGKGGGGVFQKLINLMPPHRVYIEAFLGSGRVMRMKRPADRNIGIDLDAAAISAARRRLPYAELKMVDALNWLEKFQWQGGELVYLDPPYLLETRASGQARYRFELTHHERLLRVARSLPCQVMISGYWSELYARELATWRAVTYQAKTRGCMATEWVWLNFAEPMELHDYRYLGDNFRQRQNIKKKKARWANKLLQMPALERYAVMAAIREACDDRNHRQE